MGTVTLITFHAIATTTFASLPDIEAHGIGGGRPRLLLVRLP